MVHGRKIGIMSLNDLVASRYEDDEPRSRSGEDIHISWDIPQICSTSMLDTKPQDHRWSGLKSDGRRWNEQRCGVSATSISRCALRVNA